MNVDTLNQEITMTSHLVMPRYSQWQKFNSGSILEREYTLTKVRPHVVDSLGSISISKLK